ncbi:MAG: SPOR domain-containing protein [Candidatus Saelkia tenebricola]|nr:SPOR domain-containing protein [Candidatus Saelkia tenebricola]
MRWLLIVLACVLITNVAYADKFEDAWVYFLNEKYNISERIVDSLLQSQNNSPKIYYLKALLLSKRLRFEESRVYFEKLSFYEGKWKGYALSGNADTFFLEGKFEKACLLYSTFLNRFPSSDLTSEAIYKYALCLRKEGNWSQAREYFDRLVKKYPQAISSTYARKILSENEFFFTIQIGSFLNYDNAYNLSKKVSSLGYDAHIKKIVHKGKLYYRVRIGMFQTRVEAENKFKRLAVDGFSGMIYP